MKKPAIGVAGFFRKSPLLGSWARIVTVDNSPTSGGAMGGFFFMSMRAVLFVRDLRYPQPSQVNDEDQILAIDKLVLHTIATYVTNDKKRVAWPSVRTLAEDCWKGERTVQRSLSRLEKARLLHREAGGGLRTTTYRIVGFSPIPDAAMSPPIAAPPPHKPATPPVSPVTPTPVTRDTHPPSPVTPLYKEYESTCERTLKGEGSAANQAVCLPPATPRTLALQVVNDLCLPKVLLPAVEEAISNEAKRQHIEPAAAARLISAWGAAAQAHGVPVNKFAFEDMLWRTNGSRKVSPAEDRFNHNRNVTHAVISNLLNGGAERYIGDYQSQARSLHD